MESREDYEVQDLTLEDIYIYMKLVIYFYLYIKRKIKNEIFKY